MGLREALREPQDALDDADLDMGEEVDDYYSEVWWDEWLDLFGLPDHQPLVVPFLEGVRMS